MSMILVAAVLLNVYAAVLVCLRSRIYDTKLYRPMLWNIFLSVLPVFVFGLGGLLGSVLLLFLVPLGVTVLVLTFVVWLLLLPNSSYLITELNLSHRMEEDTVPEWYDVILVITLAMSGVTNAIVNVLLAHVFFTLTVFSDTAQALLEPASLIFVGVMMLVQSFGIYLGRFPRFNSWDLKHPLSFARKLHDHFSSAGTRLQCVGFTLSYALFLILIYILVAGPVISGLVDIENVRTAIG